MSKDQQTSVSQHRNTPLQDGLYKKALSPAYDCCQDQELDHEIQIATNGSSTMSVDHHDTMTHYLKALLEEGLFEKALSLACDCFHDPELGKDVVFLETALILFTNMEKLDAMWTEVKKLHSMDQLYPTANALHQYYMPAALLTAEMLLCKEWCEKTVSLGDLQQITALWVALLWTQSGHDKEAFETKVLQVGKLIIHEPTFVLILVKSVHAEVGKLSLVLCVNLCLMAIQQPLKDPQSNLVNASRIDTNNAVLCHRLSGLLNEDTGLSCLCLLTMFTITPTKELFNEVNKVYKSRVVKVPLVPIMPSCLSCVLVHCMYSLLPSTICPLVEWKELRGKCLKYLQSSSVLNVQVKLPNQEVTMKMYVKKINEEEEEEEEEEDDDKETQVASTEEVGSVEGLSEETDQEQCGRIGTDCELRWLSSMMSLDMTWRPHWLMVDDEDHEQEISGPTESPKSCSHDTELGAQTVQACRNKLHVPLRDVMCNLEDTLQGHSYLSKTSHANHSQSIVEESPGALKPSLEEDHAYSLPPGQAYTEELCTDRDLRSTTATSQKSISEIIVISSDEDSYHEDKINRLELEKVQQLDAGESLRNQTIQTQRQQAILTPDKQCDMDPMTTDENQENLPSECPCIEGQNTFQFVESHEQDKPTAGSKDFRVGSDFLHDLSPESTLSQTIYGTVTMADAHPSELCTDADRWFQSIEQPSEASSIVGVDVTPDAITEQSLQWTAIKSLTGSENQKSDEPSWSELDLWLSEGDNDETSFQSPSICATVPGADVPGFPNLQCRTMLNLEADPRKEKCSLESTISRLRANLCGLDKCAASTEAQDINQKLICQMLSCHKSTKQQLNSQQPFHQQMTDQQMTDQQMTDQQMTGQQMTGQQMTGQQMTDQQMTGQQMTDQQMMDQQMTDQQMTDQQMTGQQMTGQQMTGQQMTDQQMTGQQMTGQQMTDQQMTDQQMTDQQMTDQQMTDQQMTDQQMTDQQMTDQQMTDQQMTDQQMTDQQMTDQQMTDQQMTDQQMTDQQMTDQQMTDQQSANQNKTNQQPSNHHSTSGQVTKLKPQSTNPQSNNPQSTSNATTNQQSSHQQVTDQQSVNQNQTNHQVSIHHSKAGPVTKLKSQSTVSESTNHETSDQQSFNQQSPDHHSSTGLGTKLKSQSAVPESTSPESTSQETSNQQSLNQQSSNHHSSAGPGTKLKSQSTSPESTSPESTSPESTNHETSNQQSTNQHSSNHHSTAVPVTKLKPQLKRQLKRQLKCQQKTANKPAVTRLATKRQSLNQPSTTQQSTDKLSIRENDETAESQTSSTSTTHQPLNTECSNKTVSSSRHLHTSSSTETACCPGNQSRNTKETNSALQHEITEVSTQDRETEVQDKSLLKSLLTAPSEKSKQKCQSLPSKRKKPNTRVMKTRSGSSLTKKDPSPTSYELLSMEMSDGYVASSSEDFSITTEVIHIRILNAHSGSSFEHSSERRGEKTFTFQDGHLAASNVNNERTEVGGCRKVSSWRNQETTSRSTVKYKCGQGNYANSKNETVEPEVRDIKDNTKDTSSNSDCSEFEVVQDLSSSWSVSGNRKTPETCLWRPKKKKVLYQEKTGRSVNAPSPTGGRNRKQSLEISESKSETVERNLAKNCSPRRKKEQSHHQGMTRFSDANGANKVQAISSPVTESEPSVEVTPKVEQACSPPSRRYNLRTVNSVQYTVVGSSTDTEVSGEDKGMKRSYCLRSTALCNAKPSGSIPKKPRRASKSRQSTQRKSQTQSTPLCSGFDCGSKLGDIVQTNCVSVKQRSKHNSAVLSSSNGISDHNNNSNSSSSSSSTTPEKDTTVTTPSTPLKEMPSTDTVTTRPTNHRGSFAEVKNPQLPWETKPPLRTYSSKKNNSSVL